MSREKTPEVAHILKFKKRDSSVLHSYAVLYVNHISITERKKVERIIKLKIKLL